MTNEELILQTLTDMKLSITELDQKLSGRISDLESNFSSRISDLENNFSDRFSGLENSFSDRISELDHKLSERIENNTALINLKIENDVTKRMELLFDGYKLTHEKQWELDRKVNELEKRLEKLEMKAG